MNYLIIIIIRIYQKSLSPDHGIFKARFPHGFCRFYPSCSEYMVQAIEIRGVIKGVGLGILRIARCNPLSKPRIDKPVHH